MKNQDNTTQENRIAARKFARDLSKEELEQVNGGCAITGGEQHTFVGEDDFDLIGC